MVKVPLDNLGMNGGMEAMAGDIIVESEEEYQQFVQENELPDGYVFSRTPFGTPTGSWKVVVKREPDIQQKDTNLEKRLRTLLKDWGYLHRFKHDYHVNGRQIDFADPDEKVALEPGAVYWHTPDKVEGKSKKEIGGTPSEVYVPPKQTDIQKQETLSKDGWSILWITGEGVRNEKDSIKNWLSEFY